VKIYELISAFVVGVEGVEISGHRQVVGERLGNGPAEAVDPVHRRSGEGAVKSVLMRREARILGGRGLVVHLPAELAARVEAAAAERGLSTQELAVEAIAAGSVWLGRA
jgi:hypothetical protein